MLARVGGPSTRSAPDGALDALLDLVPTAAALVDPVGILAHCNEAWTALAERAAPFGGAALVTPSDHDGSSYLRRLQGMDGPLALAGRRLAHAVQDAATGRTPTARIEYRVPRPDGESSFVALVGALPGGKLVLVQHLDVTDRERADEARNAAVAIGLDAEARRARSRRLERRIAAVGNHLHNPITPVRVYLHLLQSGALGGLTPGQAKAVAVAARNVERWASSEQEFQRLAAEPAEAKAAFDLAAVARGAAEARQTQALQAGITLVVRAERALPVSGHPDAVREALDRFLDAALAATPAGATVAVEAMAEGGEAVVTVRDSGPGLTGRELRGLFEPWGGRAARSDPEGLSFAFVRQLLEADHGRAWAESDGHGQGTLLGAALPLLAPGGFEPDAALRGQPA